ncbi:MAG: ACT domain-containing protein [Sporichthyaceae bacterium]|nr:ACT domain-containing protein [Sporichthyaceae bacterium]
MLLPPNLHVALLEDEMAVCRLPADAELARHRVGTPLYSVTADQDAVTVVCRASDVPAGADVERGWRAFKIEGPLDTSLVGILDSLLTPLVAAKVAVYALSTFTTDYVLVRDGDVRLAVNALRVAGHRVG